MIPLAIAIVFIWAGCVLSISFFESWMKFRAPGVDLKIGLSIGKKIFTTLNRIEWILGLLVLLSTIGLAQETVFSYLLIVAAILTAQSFWLLRDLNSRAVRIIAGEQLSPSKTHIYFVVFELVKLIVLLILGGNLLRSLT